nr:hypothetical protein [Tanacetum cinerariifolium]
MNSIEQCIIERANHEQELQNGLKSWIVSNKGNYQGLENQSNTSGDESSRSRNECNDKRTSGDDTDIRPSYDIEQMVETQKQLKKANASITQELKECKSTLAETSRTLREFNSIRDSFLIALQNKQTELEKYMSFNDLTVDYDKLEFCKEKASNVFQKEGEQYFKIQDLKAQFQDKNIAVSELNKLIEKIKGKSVDTNFEKQSILGKPPLQPIRIQPVSPRESVGSNDMVHNYYLEEAKKKAQLQKDKALNTKPSMQQSARLPNTANGNKPKPRNFN